MKWPRPRSRSRSRSRTADSQHPTPPAGRGWVATGNTDDAIDTSDLISDLVAWGFEVHRRDNVQDVAHLASGRGVQASGCDLDTMLWFIHRAVSMGRDSVGSDLSAAQRGRQVAIDLLTDHIGRERRGLEDLMRDNPGSILWPSWKSGIEKLEQILEQVVRA